MGFKETKAVTLPVLKFEDNSTRVFRFDSKIEIRDTEEKDPKTGEMIAKTIAIAQVTDMESETRGELVVGTTLIDSLETSYPEQNYVGKVFQITKETVPGKRWRKYTVLEGEWE